MARNSTSVLFVFRMTIGEWRKTHSFAALIVSAREAGNEAPVFSESLGNRRRSISVPLIFLCQGVLLADLQENTASPGIGPRYDFGSSLNKVTVHRCHQQKKPYQLVEVFSKRRAAGKVGDLSRKRRHWFDPWIWRGILETNFTWDDKEISSPSNQEKILRTAITVLASFNLLFFLGDFRRRERCPLSFPLCLSLSRGRLTYLSKRRSTPAPGLSTGPELAFVRERISMTLETLEYISSVTDLAKRNGTRVHHCFLCFSGKGENNSPLS